MFQVSVIVVTYNPDNAKLKATLDSIVSQKHVQFEVIISDDGSADKDFSWLSEYFLQHGIQHYTILENSENEGTVKNCLKGLQAARGEYVFTISPGDMYFDDLVLADCFSFAKNSNCKLCFGNSIPYTHRNGIREITHKYSTPMYADLYQKNQNAAKLMFFGGDWILGTSFFRETEMALKLFSQISGLCKYVEDNTSAAFALADGVSVAYYDRNIVWYEDGTGVSTSKSEKWAKLLKTDFDNAFSALKQRYAQDPMVDLLCCIHFGENKPVSKIRRALIHPVLTIRKKMLSSICKRKLLHVTEDDMVRLSHMLSGKES